MSKYGDDPGIHGSTAETRERAIERLRKTQLPMKDGSVRTISREDAARIAERATREAHEKLDRR